ncbi:MAG: DUF6785 family protein, partial [Planctomycetota bacterium]
MGRRHYGQVFRRALTFKQHWEVEPYEAWACRLLILAMAGVVVILSSLGLPWPLAILTVILFMMAFLVMGRLVAETGLFFMHSAWQPMGIILGFFGAHAFGPKGASILVLLCAVIIFDPRESLMPFLVNGLKICGDQRIRVPRVGWGMVAVFAAGLAIAVPIVLYVNYNYGVPGWDRYATVRAPQATFKPVVRLITELKDSKQLVSAQNLSPWDRIKQMNPNPRFLWAVGIGLVLFISVSVLRLRFTWWPLHPVIFLVWSSWILTHFWFSFLLGW